MASVQLLAAGQQALYEPRTHNPLQTGGYLLARVNDVGRFLTSLLVRSLI